MAVQTATGPGGNYQYQGNPDFRGYVAATNPSLLDYVGNNASEVLSGGGVNQAKVNSSGNSQGIFNAINNAASQYLGYTQPTAASGGSNTSGTGVSPQQQQQYVQALNATYDTPMANYQKQIAGLPAQYQTNQSLLQKQYETNVGAANQSTQDLVNTYSTQAQHVQQNQNISLAELADRMRGQNQSFQTALGNVGASQSSAAEAGKYAFAREYAINMAKVKVGAQQSLDDINNEIKTAQNQGVNYIKQLTDSKNIAMQQVLEKYNDLQVNLQNALASATGSKARDLLFYSKQLDQNAIAELTNLDKNIKASSDAYAASVANAQGNMAAYKAPTEAPAPTAVATPAQFSWNPQQGLQNIFNYQ